MPTDSPSPPPPEPPPWRLALARAGTPLAGDEPWAPGGAYGAPAPVLPQGAWCKLPTVDPSPAQGHGLWSPGTAPAQGPDLAVHPPRSSSRPHPRDALAYDTGNVPSHSVLYGNDHTVSAPVPTPHGTVTQEPLTEAEIAYGRDVVAPRIAPPTELVPAPAPTPPGPLQHERPYRYGMIGKRKSGALTEQRIAYIMAIMRDEWFGDLQRTECAALWGVTPGYVSDIAAEARTRVVHDRATPENILAHSLALERVISRALEPGATSGDHANAIRAYEVLVRTFGLQAPDRSESVNVHAHVGASGGALAQASNAELAARLRGLLARVEGQGDGASDGSVTPAGDASVTGAEGASVTIDTTGVTVEESERGEGPGEGSTHGE